ncbi:MAG: FitA-like ribbon-helix-helix domain-containing protein [Jiangellaceae bacterium]
MAVMLQVRNLPDHVHATLKARAAERGMSLSEYVGRELARIAARPTLDDVLARAESRASRLTFAEINDALADERVAH